MARRRNMKLWKLDFRLIDVDRKQVKYIFTSSTVVLVDEEFTNNHKYKQKIIMGFPCYLDVAPKLQ